MLKNAFKPQFPQETKAFFGKNIYGNWHRREVCVKENMDRKIEKKWWTKKRAGFIALGAILTFAVSYLTLGADYSKKLKVEQEKLSIAAVEKGVFAEYISVDGIVLPLETVYLDAVEGGVVEEISAVEGSQVKKDDVILTLSNGNLQLDYINRETQILELLNQIENARLTLSQNEIQQKNALADIKYQLLTAERKYETNKILFSQNSISKNEFRQSEDEYMYLKEKMQIAKQSLKQDSIRMRAQIKQMNFSASRMQQNLEMAKKNLEHLTVRAPMSGQLTSFDLKKGQLLSVGQNIAQIDVPGGYKLRANVDEHYISRVFAGQIGEVEIAGKPYKVKILRINPQVKNGFFAADFVFEKGQIPGGIKKGQNISIRLGLGSQSEALLLPRGGFAQTTGGNWAFVLDEKNEQEAVRKKIKIGRQNPQYFELLEGLQAGEKVIISSYDGFEDKDKLIIVL